VGARLISTRDASKVVELAWTRATIGRGAECEIQLPDHRVSARHCCVSQQDGVWAIQDLKSTNRTFVNGELVTEQPRRLRHGDVVRLGAQDAVLYEARFAIDERVAPHRPGPPADDEPLRRTIAELQAALLERNAEIVRVSAMYKQLQTQRSEHAAAAAAADRATAQLTGELDALRGELERERTEHAASRDAVARAQRQAAALEAQLAAQGRKIRSELDDAGLRSKELESKLRMATSDLAAARDALATANASIQTLRQAYEDAQARVEIAAAQADDSRARSS
jgi:pSer/pThr/pTyr-binding forkhead associated (FHA) protein